MEKTRSVWGYLKNHKWAIFFYLLFLFIGAVASAVINILLANCLTVITDGNFTLGLTYLFYTLIAAIVHIGGDWISGLVYFKYSNIIWREISMDLTKHCFSLSSSSFSENSTGSFTQRILNDPERIVDKLSGVVQKITSLLSGAIVIVYIITLNWIIGLAYIAVLIGSFFFEVQRQKVRRRNKIKAKKISDASYSLITEVVRSEKDIKSLDMESKLYETASQNLVENEKAHSKANMVDCNFYNIRTMFLIIFSILVLIVCVILVDKALLPLSLFLIIFTYKDELVSLVWCYGEINRSLTDISVSTSRMFSLFDEEIYSSDKFGNEVLDNVAGKIEFENVCYSYSEVEEKREKDKKGFEKVKLIHTKKEPVFEDLSFTIKPNSTVAFVGRSGSGKSTIASLITKLIECDKGEVKIDDIDIKELSKQTIRDNISMINQFPYIFDASIKENLLLAKKDASESEIWEVLKKACFDEDVLAMPNGLDTKVGETGVKLSGGQRQRLAIARALLKNSKVIIFDESTSSLDNFAQSHIQQSIENLKGKHTVIIIAHRLSTIKNVDTLYFLKDGKICGQGNFDELFENNEEFRNMFMIETI